MGFTILEHADITMLKCDAIVNSVGIDTEDYGGICRSILAKVNSDKLKQIINEVNGVYEVGDIFVTESYGLPCKKIINVITPHSNNDPDCSLLKECIRRILNECQRMHLFSVAIPRIGTGANLYNGDDVARIIINLGRAYSNYYKDMNIAFVTSREDISIGNDMWMQRIMDDRGRYHTDEVLNQFKKSSKKMIYSAKSDNGGIYDKKYFDYDSYVHRRDVFIKSDDALLDIRDYVKEYIERRPDYDKTTIVQNRINKYFGYGTSEDDSLSHVGSNRYVEFATSKNPNREGFYKIMLATRMSVREANAFFNYYGLNFAHQGRNAYDDAIRYLLDNHQYGVVEANIEFEKRGLIKLFTLKNK